MTVMFDLGNVLLIRRDPRGAFRHVFDDDAAIDAPFDELGFHGWHSRQDCGRSRAAGWGAHHFERAEGLCAALCERGIL